MAEEDVELGPVDIDHTVQLLLNYEEEAQNHSKQHPGSIYCSNEMAADLINNMMKEICVADFYYQDEWKKMDEYYNAYWPNLIAGMRSTYFSNPWSVIALLAGIVLFILTVIQTVYSVKD